MADQIKQWVPLVAVIVGIVLSSLITLGISASNNANSSSIAIVRLQQQQANDEEATRNIRASVHNMRSDVERILIIDSALARANGIAVPTRKDVP